MDLFSFRLEQLCAALRSNDYAAPEAFSGLAVDFGKTVSLATAEWMLAARKNGASEVELVAAFPLAMAFLVNGLAYCAGQGGNVVLVDHLFDTARRIAAQLGDGDPDKAAAKRAATNLN